MGPRPGATGAREATGVMSVQPSRLPEEQSHPLKQPFAWLPWLLLFAWWAGLRVVFFTGIIGSDDFFHLRYAIQWDAPPVNHWEARLAFNALLRAAIRLLGYHEWVCALPSLAGSLLLVTAAIRGAYLGGGCRSALLAGWIAASMPLDVILSTVPSASPLSSGIAGWFFVELLGRRWILAALIGGLATLIHPVNVHFVLMAAVMRAVFERQIRPLTAAALAVCVYFLLDFGINTLSWGDPFHSLRILSQWHDPDPYYKTGSAEWFLYPFRSLVFSKEFGIAALLACCAPLLRPAGRKWTLLCAATVAAFWLWIGFGSVKPTEYEPFWRLARFQYPLIVPISMALADVLPGLRARITFSAGILSVLHILLLAGSGSWGESVEISRRFLDEVRRRPDRVFLTDLRTEREMIGLNGFQPIGNLRSWPQVCRSAEAQGDWLLAENPLNLANYGDSFRPRPVWTPTGRPLMVLKAVPRRAFAWAPRSWVSRYPVLLRRPEARLLPVRVSGCQD